MDHLIDDVAAADGSSDDSGSRQAVLKIVTAFGVNPGNLRMHLFVPSGPKKPRALVVALHGCTQNAPIFAAGTGWMRLAARHDFLLLLPEQTKANNQQTCFNWYEPKDARRGVGEAESIHEMIETAIEQYDADPAQIFITGLSAGGAMACTMLATYPELFVGGAILAGLPYGAASSVSEAFESMYTGKVKEPRAWGDAVRGASSFKGQWPSVAVWHGTADAVVKPINAGEIVKQWTNVHGIGAEIPAEDHIGFVTRRIWRDGAKRAQVTEYSIPGMGHGVPIDGDPSAPFFLPAGIDSSEYICRDWGLMQESKPRGLLAKLGFKL